MNDSILLKQLAVSFVKFISRQTLGSLSVFGLGVRKRKPYFIHLAFIKEGVDELADRIASEYANTGSSVSEVIELLVTDVDNLDKYARALSYLESVQSISSVQVKRVSRNDVMFILVNRGGLAAIDQSIVLGKTLELVNNNEQLTYRLLQ